MALLVLIFRVSKYGGHFATDTEEDILEEKHSRNFWREKWEDKKFMEYCKTFMVIAKLLYRIEQKLQIKLLHVQNQPYN